jgi:four helix bundle protein
MGKIQKFEDLLCWQASRELVKKVFVLSGKGPFCKDYDTKSQFGRAALSSMNNIAEGFARFNKKEFVRFLDFSQSSASEVKSMIYVAEDLNYLNSKEINELQEAVDKTRNLTLALIKYINQSQTKRTNINTLTP